MKHMSPVFGIMLWQHHYGPKEVARHCRSNIEVAFLAGLLYAIGGPALLQTIIELAKKEQVGLTEGDTHRLENTYCHQLSVAEFDYDVLFIGSGPAGQKSAIQAAKASQYVVIIEFDSLFGGVCVHRGTIPSKTLRENALRVKSMHQNAALADFKLGEDTEMVTLIDRLDEVLKSYDKYMRKPMDRNKVERIHGRASFIDNQTISIAKVGGDTTDVRAKTIITAAGSYPRTPDNIPIDHEHIFDSDSILSMLYLPSSLTVLG
jgi:hypothetical protein